MTTLPAKIEIELTLGEQLREWGDERNPVQRRLLEGIETGVAALAAELGIGAEPILKVKDGRKRVNLSVSVGGSMLPYSTELVRRLIEVFTGRRCVEVSLDSSWQSWFDAGDSNSFADFLARLAVEIIRQRPDSLFGEAQLEDSLRRANDALAGRSSTVPPERLKTILESLLRLKLPLPAIAPAAHKIADDLAQARMDIEIVEALASHLTPNRIEIGLNSEYLGQLFGIPIPGRGALSIADLSSEKIRALFKTLSDELFYELGVRVPEIVLAASGELRPRELSFKINHFRCAPQLGIGPNQALANGSRDKLDLLGISHAEPAINPANNKPGGLIRLSDRETADGFGLRTWDAVEYLALALSRELRRNADCLLHGEIVEYELARLDEVFPELTRAVMNRHSLARLTRILRVLLDEEISIRDLRAILERVLTCEHVVFDTRDHIVFDDRLVFHSQPAADWRDDGHSLAQHVRVGLRQYISHKCTLGQSSLLVYLLDQEIEELLFQHVAFERGGEGKKLDEENIERIRAAIRKEAGSLPASYATPALLTLAEGRYLLRRLIAEEFPDLPVLSYDELSPHMNIQPIARISLPKQDSDGFL